MSLLIPIASALGSGLLFTLMQMQMKHLTTPTSSPFLLPQFMGYLFPIWAGLFVVTDATGLLTYNLSPKALLFPLGWACCATSTTVVLIFLFRKFSLTEVAGYRKALLTLGTLGVDVTLFQQHFSALRLGAVGLLLGGALGLSHSSHRWPNAKEAVILVLWSAAFTLQLTLYKEGILHQPHVMANAILAQSCSTFIYACMSLFQKPAQPDTTPLPHLPLVLMVGCALLGTLIEGFGYAGLPLAIATLLTILPATLFAAHDLLGGHIARSPRAYAALAALATGFGLLMLGH